jgi:hypothetical protein
MVEQQDANDIQVDITPEDVRAAMAASPLMALQVQNRALTRKIRELQSDLLRVRSAYVDSVTAELTTVQEDSNANSGR